MTNSNEDSKRIVSELVEKQPICTLTTVTTDGDLVARPMTRQDSAFDGTINLVAPRDGDAAREISAHSAVNLVFRSSDGFVSLSGNARVLADQAAVEKEWSPMVAAWFPEGPEGAAVITIDCRSAEYWKLGDNAVSKAVSIAKQVFGNSEEEKNNRDTVEF